ncbi:hypothetical protein BAU15_14095 [Enterococcus sp. JM4C]|uniref:Rgg/GadR/MutR family transcriptional regulator n=1 Tax=Candidatus Enterococcus huntleyi TaxID=1857217 RepID=UPI0013796FCD|nr:Rgg/GadR/MutR family transcriptional regulator [Enterococcus sp. JM4C]KAF1295999.1 hypothetical protein BAU15_14095 [Enterococcus sp. JM4C]
MDYGETFKMIRKNKGLTLKEAAGEALSTAQLSRFENGKTMLTLDQFFICLEQMNTTIEEFQFIQKNTWRDQYAAILDEVEQLNLAKDTQGLYTRANVYFNESQRQYDWYYFFGCFFENLAISNETEAISELKYIDEMKHFFLKCDLWGDRELRVLGMFVFLFDVDTLQMLVRIAIKRGKIYRSVRGDNRLFYFLLINCFSTFIYHGRISEARDILAHLENEIKDNIDLLFPQISLLFNKGILKFIENDPEAGVKYCSQAISVCTIFKQEARAQRLTKRLDEWRNAEDPAEYKELVIELGYLTD